jgi:site-specific DNA recombinase
MRMAAIYARVSSEQQREENTIASQTASLIEFASSHDLEVPGEWVFEDEGYSGATLERPGLERVRDLAAEGQIQVVLAYAPDRLSRKYAYQILLIEEFARHGVETLFVKSPQGDSAEDQLLLQFQGMIAEYERAQILERSRRGKRHRAHSGEISVMSGAPYGYRYIRKTDEAPAAYMVDEAEARVVQRVYEMYTVDGRSIGEIARRLNAEGIPTRKLSARWERSTVWGVLRNSAYRGIACFGKTRICARTRVMRPQRRRGVTTPSTTAGHERPREEWIEIPVPPLITEESFARAQELLQENKIRSRRRTIAPSIVQGLVSCAKCGYAFSRTSTQTSARKIHYYKCIGSDGWRKLGGPVCDNGRFVRQELLDQIVWAEVIRLLEEPALIRQELDRRLAAARSSDPTRKREQSLHRELTHVGKGVERLLNAYQEGLLSIEQLRERMPGLRQRQQALRAELQAIADQTNDRAAFLRLAETLTAFLARLRSASATLSVTERQRIVRLLVKDVLVGEDTITIRHSIPIPSAPPQNGGSQPEDPNYLLCTGSVIAIAVEHRAGRTGPRVGATRAPTRSIRGRLQCLCPQSASRRASDGEHHCVHHLETQTQSEPGEKYGGKTLGAEVPGLQLYERDSTETADCAEGTGTLQKAGARADATDSRDQHRGNGCRTRKLSPRMARLLRRVPNPVGVERAGSMDQATTAVVLMEAVETRCGTVRRADPTGCEQGSCRSYGQESSRSVASR